MAPRVPLTQDSNLVHRKDAAAKKAVDEEFEQQHTFQPKLSKQSLK
jgi:hypothetical protein